MKVLTKRALQRRFGANLRHWRRERGLTQEDLAEIAGFARNQLSHIETGRCGATLQGVHRLCVALDVSADDLMHRKPDRITSRAVSS